MEIKRLYADLKPISKSARERYRRPRKGLKIDPTHLERPLFWKCRASSRLDGICMTCAPFKAIIDYEK